MHFHFEDSCLFFFFFLSWATTHACTVYAFLDDSWRRGLVGDLLQGYIMCRGYLFIICSPRGRRFSSVPKALLVVVGHPAHHLYFYYYCYYYFIVSSKWGNSDMMHIFVYEDNPLFGGPLPLAFWRDGWTEQGIIYNCLFPLRPVESSCELAEGRGDLGLWHGIKQAFKPIPWQEVKATRTLPAEHIWRYVQKF